MSERTTNKTPRKAIVQKTYADWMVIGDKQGTFFRVNRHSVLDIAPDCLDRLDGMINNIYDEQQLAVLFTVRACVAEIQRLQPPIG